jgi:hypothetical protein
MAIPSEAEAARIVAANLTEWLGASAQVVREQHAADRGVDFVFGVGPRRFIAEYKSSAQAPNIKSAVEQLQSYRSRSRDVLLVVVPYMGDVGREICREVDISWMDLSGNAHIAAGGILVHVEGRPNKYRQLGRPSSVFSPVASRVVRWLLAHPDEPASQREISKANGLDEGFTSRIVGRLVAEGFAERGERSVKVRDPALLLASWHEAYDFSRHRLIRTHGTARSSESLVAEVSRKFKELGIDHAATGLAAAWLHTRFAGFRLATFFIEDVLDADALGDAGLREVQKGENVWLVVPNDVGVFQPIEEIDGVPCVHKVQVYVDLKGHPERAREAAESIRSAYLSEVHDG